jgi:two-component system sensor histidine kinase PilS (NtrC family)
MSDNTTSLKTKIKALITIRALFITLLLGSSFLFKAGYARFPYLQELSYLIISSYILTIIYAMLVERIRTLTAFAYSQLVLDVVFETILIGISGGINSWFAFTLILTVISSSIVLNRKAGYIIASLCSLSYSTLVSMQFYRHLPFGIEGAIDEKTFLYNIFILIISLYLVAYLSGYLSSRLEKTAKKLEEKDTDLRDLDFFNKEVIESLPSGLFTTDAYGTILVFNRAAERIIGLSRSSVIGKRIDEMLPFFHFPFKDGRREEVIRIKDTQKVIGFNITPLKDLSGADSGFIGIFQDLTLLKLLETEMKKKEQMAAIGELSANIAHEIRNPLASLKGSIEMLREDNIPQSQKTKLMEIALNEMERLNRIITDFLTYSRPSSPVFSLIDIISVLDETMELLKHSEHNKDNIFFLTGYSGSLETRADSQKMRQVFWNLGLNALEAMPGGGELNVRAERVNGKIAIVFMDTGYGISAQDTEKIFYPFFTTKENGTGLGLAIAYRIVEEHEGTIQVSSTPGKGTTVTVILPDIYGKK